MDEEAATTKGDTVSYAGLGLSRGKTLGSVGEVREVLTKSAELPRSRKNLAPTLVKLWAKRPPEGRSLLAGVLVHPGVAFPYFFRFGHLFLARCAFIHLAFGHVVAPGCGACRGWALRVCRLSHRR